MHRDERHHFDKKDPLPNFIERRSVMPEDFRFLKGSLFDTERLSEEERMLMQGYTLKRRVPMEDGKLQLSPAELAELLNEARSYSGSVKILTGSDASNPIVDDKSARVYAKGLFQDFSYLDLVRHNLGGEVLEELGQPNLRLYHSEKERSIYNFQSTPPARDSFEEFTREKGRKDRSRDLFESSGSFEPRKDRKRFF